MPKSDYKRLSDQIEFIADEPDNKNISSLNENDLGISPCDNEYGAHTLLKLSYLNYYMKIFTTVASSYKAKGKSRYLDWFRVRLLYVLSEIKRQYTL